jgi:hypothetical protein
LNGGDDAMAAGSDPIDDAEVLLRRIPAAFRPDPGAPPTLDAFLPHRANDPDGLSLTRQRFAEAEVVGRSAPAGRACYVGRVTAGQIRRAGMNVVPDPKPDNPGHALIPELNSSARGDPALRLRARQLLDACTDVVGPFDGQRT